MPSKYLHLETNQQTSTRCPLKSTMNYLKNLYTKAPQNVVENIKKSHSKMVTDLELQDRVFRTTEMKPFITIKDHKPNFQNNPSCRLINPYKPEIGKISQQITAEIKEFSQAKNEIQAVAKHRSSHRLVQTNQKQKETTVHPV